MRCRSLVLALVCAVLALVGCSPSADDGQARAVEIAQAGSPLVEVTKVEGARQLPPQLMARGRDKDGRELIVWVGDQVRRYVYLDQLISRDRAVEIAERYWINRADVDITYLGYMESGAGKPVFWHVGSPCRYIRMNAETGDVLVTGRYGCTTEAAPVASQRFKDVPVVTAPSSREESPSVEQKGERVAAKRGFHLWDTCRSSGS